MFLVKASQADIKTRMVDNKFPVLIAAFYALSAFGQWFFMPKSMPATSVAAQVVFAAGMGFLLLVVTVGLEKVQKRELFGGGDIKIISATTLFLTIEAFMVAMLVSCVLFVLGAVVERRKFSSWTGITLPFVPFWTAGFVVAVALTYLL